MAGDDQRAVAQQLADQLTDGFLALSGEYQLLREQHRQLEDQLAWAKKEHEAILRRYTPDTADDDFAVFVDDLVEAGKGTTNGQSDWVELLSQDPSDGRSGRAFLIRQAELALETLKNIGDVNLPENRPLEVKIWNGASADNVHSDITSQRLRTVMENGVINGDHSPHEKDFTVNGTPSKLGCPFAKASHVLAAASEKLSLTTRRTPTSKFSGTGRSKRSSINDPIKAEINGTADVLSAVPSIEGSAPACPIRFLDQHSPEEVAQYFEKHKHEIPRSHAVCIKRFQSNTTQIRELDAKYGNMVSMITGLGQKHQPMLPDKPIDEEIDVEEDDASEKVKNWADGVSASLRNGEPESHEEAAPAPPDPDGSRESHFDRQLKEVRVGESPSRPWGITVPSKYANAAEEASTRSPATASPLEAPQAARQPSGCPFGHDKMQAHVSDMPDAVTSRPEPLPVPKLQMPGIGYDAHKRPEPEPVAKPTPSPSPPPQMVFTGPVFIGYSPDLIQQFMAQAAGKPA